MRFRVRTETPSPRARRFVGGAAVWALCAVTFVAGLAPFPANALADTPSTKKASDDTPPAAVGLRLEVRSGFAWLRQGGRDRLVLPGDGPLDVHGDFELELNVRGVLQLGLLGAGSVRWTGPATVGVRREAAEVRLRLGTVGVVEFEGRRAGPWIELPRGQVLRPRQSAFRLDGRPGGIVDFQHRAGLPVELDLGGRYTFELAQGRRIRVPERLR